MPLLHAIDHYDSLRKYTITEKKSPNTPHVLTKYTEDKSHALVVTYNTNRSIQKLIEYKLPDPQRLSQTSLSPNASPQETCLRIADGITVICDSKGNIQSETNFNNGTETDKKLYQYATTDAPHPESSQTFVNGKKIRENHYNPNNGCLTLEKFLDNNIMYKKVEYTYEVCTSLPTERYKVITLFENGKAVKETTYINDSLNQEVILRDEKNLKITIYHYVKLNEYFGWDEYFLDNNKQILLTRRYQTNGQKKSETYYYHTKPFLTKKFDQKGNLISYEYRTTNLADPLYKIFFWKNKKFNGVESEKSSTPMKLADFTFHDTEQGTITVNKVIYKQENQIIEVINDIPYEETQFFEFDQIEKTLMDQLLQNEIYASEIAESANDTEDQPLEILPPTT